MGDIPKRTLKNVTSNNECSIIKNIEWI